MNKGTVKWFSPQRGYGFITGEDGQDVYVHYSGINAEGFKTLRRNTEVFYDVEDTERGKIAVNVTAIA